jgi:tryptophanyl-tRNA synthetase
VLFRSPLFAAFLDPIRKRREEWLKQPGEIKKILERGKQKAREVAGETLNETMKAMGLRR